MTSRSTGTLFVLRKGSLEEMTAMGLPVDWGVLRVGWEGVGSWGRQLVAEDVSRFADARISQVEGFELPHVAELCVVTHDGAIGGALSRLAPDPGEQAERIWRYYLLRKLLEQLTDAPAVDGLTELTGFWSAFGFPEDSPHTVQGRGNDLEPEEYYTWKSFERILADHRSWLTSEAERLRITGAPGPS